LRRGNHPKHVSHDRRYGILTQPAQSEPPETVESQESLEPRVDLLRPIGRHNQERDRIEPAGAREEFERPQHQLIGPLKVVENQDNRFGGRKGLERVRDVALQARNGRGPLQFRGLGVSLLSRKPIQPGLVKCQEFPARSQEPFRLLLPLGSTAVGDGLQWLTEGLQRPTADVQAFAREDDALACRSLVRQLHRKARFANPAFASDQDDGAPARAEVLQVRFQDRQRLAATGKTRPVEVRSGSRRCLGLLLLGTEPPSAPRQLRQHGRVGLAVALPATAGSMRQAPWKLRPRTPTAARPMP
jgi:hypothetical protein